MNHRSKKFALVFLGALLLLWLAGPVSAWAASESERLFQQATFVETGERDMDKAVALYQRVTELSPNSPLAARAFERIGAIEERRDRLDDSIKAYSQSLSVASIDGKTREQAQAGLAHVNDVADRRKKEKLAALYEAGDRSTVVAKRKWHVSGALEIYSIAHAADATESTVSNTVDGLNAIGGSASGKVISDPGHGVRVGLFRSIPSAPRWLLGVTGGYIIAPKIAASIFDPANDVAEDITAKAHYYRVMTEFQTEIRFAKKLGFMLGGGVGLAKGNITIANGSNLSLSDGKTGVSGEATGALTGPFDNLEFQLGIRYSAFPSMATDTDFKYEWHPISVFFGVMF